MNKTKKRKVNNHLKIEKKNNIDRLHSIKKKKLEKFNQVYHSKTADSLPLFVFAFNAARFNSYPIDSKVLQIVVKYSIVYGR